ncbi:MAG: nuclear transport factor 2 family protein [Proteobacteria bacterium]|nr:nuclear transport factor 2 family protein [Pseudomonadota bacterium]
MNEHPIAAWHRVLAARDATGLHGLLADDAVFHSPVVHTPQRGRALVAGYLAAAFVVLGNDSFRYVREIVGERDAALEFATTIDGIHVNGVDLIGWNEHGLITDFKVMLRPLKAIELIHRLMGQMLQST